MRLLSLIAAPILWLLVKGQALGFCSTSLTPQYSCDCGAVSLMYAGFGMDPTVFAGNCSVDSTFCCNQGSVQCYASRVTNIYWRGLGLKDLSGNQITGNLPDLSMTTGLNSLNLANNRMSGTIDSTFLPLATLSTLDVSYNAFRGNLSSLISAYSVNSEIYSLSFEANLFNGSIPSLSALNSISHLDLSNNSLTGAFPSTSALTAISYFNISYNKLSGIIPDTFSMNAFELFDVSHNNFLGPIPTTLAAPYEVGFSHNFFNGSVPYIDAQLSIDFSSNNLTGSIPSSYTTSFTGYSFDFSSNELCGACPVPAVNATAEQGQWQNLMSQMSMSDSVPLAVTSYVCGFLEVCGQAYGIEYIVFQSSIVSGDNFSANQISVNATDYYSNPVVGLTVNLVAYSNSNCSTSIPSTLFTANVNATTDSRGVASFSTGFSYLGTSNTIYLKVSGISAQTVCSPVSVSPSDCYFANQAWIEMNGGNANAPPAIANACCSIGTMICNFVSVGNRVTEIYWTNQNLSSNLASSFQNLTYLSSLYVSNNNITGQIPSWLNTMSSLTSLVLGSNQLTGPLPDLSSLTSFWTLDVSKNQLNGSIPNWVAGASLQSISLQLNSFTGQIPTSMGSPNSALYLFNASNNLLSGGLPLGLANISNLYYLDLHSNNLTGTIPYQFGNSTHLSTLDLSQNQFTGDVAIFDYNCTIYPLNLENNHLCGSYCPNVTSYASDTDIPEVVQANCGFLPKCGVNYVNFISIPQTAPAGVAFNPEPVLNATDYYNQPVTNASIVLNAYYNSACNFSIPSGFAQAPSTALTNGSGVAVYNDVQFNGIQMPVYIQGSAGSVNSSCVVVNITAGNPSSASFVQFAGSASAGQLLTPQPAVTVSDQYGNPNSNVNVTISAYSDSKCLSPLYTTQFQKNTILSNSSGISLFTGLVYNGLDGTIYLRAVANTQSLLLPTSNCSAVIIGAGLPGPGTISFNQLNTAANAGVPFTSATSIEATDSFANPLVGVQIILNGYSDSKCSSSLTSNQFPVLSALTSAAGLASFSNVEYYGLVGTIYLQGSFGKYQTSCQGVSVSAGTPFQSSFVNGSANSTTGIQFMAPPVVLVVDQFENAVTGALVTINAFTDSCGGKVAAIGFIATTATSGANGQATFSGTLYNGTSTSLFLQASVNGISSGTCQTVSNTVPVLPTASSSITSSPTTSTSVITTLPIITSTSVVSSITTLPVVTSIIAPPVVITSSSILSTSLASATTSLTSTSSAAQTTSTQLPPPDSNVTVTDPTGILKNAGTSNDQTNNKETTNNTATLIIIGVVGVSLAVGVVVTAPAAFSGILNIFGLQSPGVFDNRLGQSDVVRFAGVGSTNALANMAQSQTGPAALGGNYGENVNTSIAMGTTAIGMEAANGILGGRGGVDENTTGMAGETAAGPHVVGGNYGENLNTSAAMGTTVIGLEAMGGVIGGQGGDDDNVKNLG